MAMPAASFATTTTLTNQLHLPRRIQHIFTGLLLLLLSHVIPPYPLGFVLLSLATASLYYIHTKRIHSEEWDEWYVQKFGGLLRRHEIGEWEEISHGATTKKKKRKTPPLLPGAFHFLLGTSLAALFFPADVARTALLVLSLADPMAGIVGASIAGSAACALTAVLCTYAYVRSPGSIGPALSFRSRAGVGAMTAFAEAVAGRHVLPTKWGEGVMDDNLWIPLVVGCSIVWLDESDHGKR